MSRQTTNKSGNILQDIMQNGQLAWRLYSDPRVSTVLKALLPISALAYFIIPIDLLPDFIPFVGQLDDLAIILLLVRLFVSLAPPDVVAEYRNPGAGGPTVGRSSRGKAPSQPPYDDVVDADFRVVDKE